MSTRGKYEINPAPYLSIIANPKGKTVKLKRPFWGHKAGTVGTVTTKKSGQWLKLKGSPPAKIKPADFGDLIANPARSVTGPGLVVIKKPRKNPAYNKKNSIKVPGGFLRTTFYGRYIAYNEAGKKIGEATHFPDATKLLLPMRNPMKPARSVEQRDAQRRVALKRQLRAAGKTIPANISTDTAALRAMRRKLNTAGKKKARNPLKSRHAVTTAPPMKRKTRKKSPARKKRRNPMTKRKVGTKAGRWHHKKGSFTYNPLRKKKRKAVTKKRTRNPMSKKRRGSHKRRNKNPMRRRGGSRRSSRRSRNPVGQTVRELFGQPMLTFAAGVVTAGVANSTIIDRINSPSSGQRSFDLPFVDYSMLASASTAGSFQSKNALVLAAYKLVLGGAIGYLLRNQAPRFSQGYLVGTVAGAISDVLVQQRVIVQTPTGPTLMWGRGTSRMWRGAGLVPGVNTLLTGPAQSFMRPQMRMNNMPANRGAGAAVGPGTMRDLEVQSEGAFRGAN